MLIFRSQKKLGKYVIIKNLCMGNLPLFRYAATTACWYAGWPKTLEKPPPPSPQASVGPSVPPTDVIHAELVG